jgi:hypothetical protein
MKMACISIVSLALGLLLAPATVRSSDHADPIFLKPNEEEANLTGLFTFPDGDRMIVILDARPALTAPPPYNLEPFEYAIYMDLHSPVTYDSAEDRTRYGGTIVRPEGIHPDVTIRLRLNNDTTVKSKSFEGLRNPDSVRLWTGVRDDPFIFPRFFKKNVIAMVLSIPFSAFPEGQKDWLLWATSARVKDGSQVDHVGRANRTQLGRFDFLNTLPPNEHVAAIRKKSRSRVRIQKFLMDCFPPLVNAYRPLFAIRDYDYVPDVMIFTTRYPAGFPNGRRLPDDVALLTCEQGDCPLIENAFIDSKQGPRATTNDKPFLTTFPYLAAPWPPQPQQPVASGLCMPLLGVLVLGVGLVAVAVWAFVRCWRKRAVA